jgi:hypothetical protein
VSELELFAEHELTPVETEDRAFHERIVDDVKEGIEKLASIGDASLKVLRDRRLYRTTHKTFEDYCQARFGFKRAYANFRIAFTDVLEDLATRVAKLPATEYQARPLTKLPTPELQAQAWERAQANSGQEQPSASKVSEAVNAIQAELEAEKRRSEEFRAESNSHRKEARALKEQIVLLQKEQPVKTVEKEVVPADYESLKTRSAALEKELAKVKAEQAKVVEWQVRAKMRGYQDEVNDMERQKAQIEEVVERKKAYLKSIDGDLARIETHRGVIDGGRLELISLAAFLNDMEPMADPDTVRRWLALADMHAAATESIRMVFGPARPALSVVRDGN